jgi:hypothetical protein
VPISTLLGCVLLHLAPERHEGHRHAYELELGFVAAGLEQLPHAIAGRASSWGHASDAPRPEDVARGEAELVVDDGDLVCETRDHLLEVMARCAYSAHVSSCAVIPASTKSNEPVMYDASSLARNATARPISRGVPRRPSN